MTRPRKLVLSLALVAAAAYGLKVSNAEARPSDGHAIACVVDVVVETRNQSNTLVGTEVYHKEFVLQEGGRFSDDFSTRTRFKFFDAFLQKNNGESTVSADWFADVTVFNSVDFQTSVTLEDGAKRGKSTGSHTLFTSGGSTTTTYSLVCAEQ
ncbi:MAG: hypothetical protein U0835_24225 [Isosphaeraceae bacterium]